jgi:hypothetical protein
VREDVRRAEEELQQLWRARRTYLAQLRHHLERQLTELQAAEEEPVPAFGHMREPRENGRSTPGSVPSREAPELLQELRELPPRGSAPTPSWLDVVEDK